MNLNDWTNAAVIRHWDLRPSEDDQYYTTGLAREGVQSSMSVGFRNTETGKYQGTRRVTFTRMFFEAMFRNIEPSVEAWDVNTLHDLLPIISAKYGIVLDKEDVINVVLDRWSFPVDIEVVAANTSKLYDGRFTLRVNYKVTPLDEVIKITDHDAIVDRFPRSEPKMRYELRYYGFDFTDYKHIIEKYHAGFVYNSSAGDFLAMLNSSEVRGEMGSPTFAPFYAGGPPVAHTYYLMKCEFRGLTTAVPDANQAYKYVAVWTASQSAAGIGRLLLHYD